MDYSLCIQLGSKVSVVVYPMDDYTGEIAAASDINAWAPGLPNRPLRKPEGYFVFCDLPGNTYQIQVDSQQYFSEVMTIPVPQLDPSAGLVYISLKPRPSYSFPVGTPLIRFSVRDTHDRPLPDTKIKAIVSTEGCVRAKLGKDGASKDSKQISLVNITGKIAPGDGFLINRVGSPNSEMCHIIAKDGVTKQCMVHEPLLFDHIRGEPLLPVIQTRTDERGEGVIYFRYFPEKRWDVTLQFSYQDRTLAREVSLEEGRTLLLGKIQI